MSVTDSPPPVVEFVKKYYLNEIKWNEVGNVPEATYLINYKYYSEKFSIPKATTLIKVKYNSGKYIMLIQHQSLKIQIYLPSTLNFNLQTHWMNCNIIHTLLIAIRRK